MSENNRYREEEKDLEQDEDIVDSTEEVHQEEQKTVEPETKPEKNKKVKKLQEQIEKLELEVANYKNEMLKDRAELENFKRRTNEERIKDRKYANQDFFQELIGILDVFDKAVSVKTDDPKLQNYLIGFTMVNNQLGQILENYGVKKIKAMGEKFDPMYHSAIETIATDEYEPGIVIEEVMTGYTYKDRILRPSMVKVSAQKENI